MKTIILAFTLSLPMLYSASTSAAVVGTCNSDQGCKTLQRACDKVNGTVKRHGPNGVGGNGSCVTKNTSSVKRKEFGLVADATAGNKMVVLDQLKPANFPPEDAFCGSRSFCEILKRTCKTSGGVFKRLGRGKGVCKD